ncbi:unnamed protein product [Parnassius mnemosyne]|uniref:PiggyBac transposable element-derived protein domain-containing protein n=1 Tax=Parnassius mnemosyne TaxID=213953 RepID=A0AAV1LBK3_9NEOP
MSFVLPDKASEETSDSDDAQKFVTTNIYNSKTVSETESEDEISVSPKAMIVPSLSLNYVRSSQATVHQTSAVQCLNSVEYPYSYDPYLPQIPSVSEQSLVNVTDSNQNLPSVSSCYETPSIMDQNMLSEIGIIESPYTQNKEKTDEILSSPCPNFLDDFYLNSDCEIEDVAKSTRKQKLVAKTSTSNKRIKKSAELAEITPKRRSLRQKSLISQTQTQNSPKLYIQASSKDSCYHHSQTKPTTTNTNSKSSNKAKTDQNLYKSKTKTILRIHNKKEYTNRTKSTSLTDKLTTNKTSKAIGLCEWVGKEFAYGVQNLKENQFTTPNEVGSPLEYFYKFIDEDLIQYIRDQTILYAYQKDSKELTLSTQDIKDFFSVEIFMGIIQLPAYVDYWSKDFKVDCVINVMCLKKYQLIRRYLHFNDSEVENESNDRYYKIRPLFDKIISNCRKIEECPLMR